MKILNRSHTSVLKTISWWEYNRLIYNLYMLIIGLLSFFVGYITIPFVYILIGLSLNLVYTISWLAELLFIRPIKSDRITSIYTRSFILIYYAYSTVSVLLYIHFPALLDWAVMLWMPNDSVSR
ncbi:hypothetical protein [Fulvivirga ligni]|uniref:hypothetical protein n=1 Tax=Fulvivirga ligni TaxID=2904246 RepID=UPI001F291B3F|nr:hypothetical protein [Fulvivirga ligni]UII19637.1 hypothetical protein LVD16_17495 [Fulvivirga ligni]